MKFSKFYARCPPNAWALHFPSPMQYGTFFTQCVLVIFDARWWKLMPCSFQSLLCVWSLLLLMFFDIHFFFLYLFYSLARSFVRSVWFCFLFGWFFLFCFSCVCVYECECVSFTLSRYTKLHRLFSAYDGSAAEQTDIIEYHHAKHIRFLLTTDQFSQLF